MPPLKYVGRSPDSDSSVVTKTWTDGQAATVAITTANVNAAIATQAGFLSTQTYVDAQHALFATKAAVDAHQATYVNATQKGVANGVAAVDSSGNLLAGEIPAGVSTDSITLCYTPASAGTVALTPGTSHTVTSTTPTEYTAATITIPDPGYPYIPLPFVYIAGIAGGAAPSRDSGSSKYGQIMVMPPFPSTTIYGFGICTASTHLNYHVALPYASAVLAGINVTPLTQPPVIGSITLNLNLSCWSGNSFSFNGTGMIFYVLVFPSM